MKYVLLVLLACVSDTAFSASDFSGAGCAIVDGLVEFCQIDLCVANGVVPCPVCEDCDIDVGTCVADTECCATPCDPQTEICVEGACVVDTCTGECNPCQHCDGASSCEDADCDDCDISCDCDIFSCEECICGTCTWDSCCVGGTDDNIVACGDYQEISTLACYGETCIDDETCIDGTSLSDEAHCLGWCSMEKECAGYTWFPESGVCMLLRPEEASNCQLSCVGGDSSTCITKMNFSCGHCKRNECGVYSGICAHPDGGVGYCFTLADRLGEEGDRYTCFRHPCIEKGIFGDPTCPPEKHMECGTIDENTGEAGCVCETGYYLKCASVDDAFEVGVVWTKGILENTYRVRNWDVCRQHCIDHGKCRHFAYFVGVGWKRGHCKLYAYAINKTGFRKTWHRSVPEFTEFYFGVGPALLSVVEHDYSGLDIKDMPLPGSCKPHGDLSACGKGDKLCYCTPDCEEYSDCCDDYYVFCGNKTMELL